MSSWKKNSIAFLISLMLFSMLPVSAFAQTVTCPPGQQPNTARTGCVAIPITPITIPTTVPGPCSGLSGAALSRCNSNVAAQGTVARFNPNINLNSGNSYGGMSISGVGGAIASCTNAGAFLVNTATKLLSSTTFGKKAKALSANVSSGGEVQVADKVAQDKLASIEKTDKCLDGIAYAVAKNALAQVTVKTLNWVNTGLNGNPLYVQNIDSLIQRVEDEEVRTYLQSARNSDPIFGNALQSTIRQSITGRSDGTLNLAMNTPQSHAYNSFMADFTSGGWGSLLNPSNNPIGALFTATDIISRKVGESKQNTRDEVQRNNGFLDMKHCVQYATVNTDNTSQTIANGLSSNPACLKWVTDTPGSIIASQVQAITNSPVRQLEYADQINEVLGGFFDGFVNNLLARGLRGSGSSINFGFSSSGTNVVLDSNGLVINPNMMGDGSLGYQSAGGGNALGQNFDISRPQQFKAILQTQYNYLNRAIDAQAALARVVPAIGALDYCIPGPNPNWSSNVSGNWSTFTSSLQQQRADDPSTLERIAGSIPVIGGLLKLFGGDDEPPQIWSTQGVLSDPASGLSVQVPRTFFNTSSKFDGGISKLLDGINRAYNQVGDNYRWYDYNREVDAAFKRVAQGDADISFIDGYLREVYTETSSLLSYNQAASQIDDGYDTTIGQTQSNIDQMEAIRKQINAIVTQAKSDYIAKRAAAGNPVDMACINTAYQIDNSKIVPVGREEPDSTTDPVVQHSIGSASYFYNEIIK